MATRIKLRRDTLANWTTVNPIPAQGEPCFVTDTDTLVIGDGTSHFLDLLPGFEPGLFASADEDGVVLESALPERLSEAGLTESINEGIAALRGRQVIGVYDDFSQHSDGPLQAVQALVGGPWIVSGAAPTVIQGGLATSSGTGYAYQHLGSAPIAVSCEVVWSGTGTASSMTMAVTDGSANVNNLRPHFNFGPNGFNATVRKDGGSFDGLLAGVWKKPMLVDGMTVYRITMLLRGSTFIVIGPNGETFSTVDTRLVPLPGNYIFWEPGGTTTISGLKSVAAFTANPSGTDSFDDLTGLIAAGLTTFQHGQVVGNRGSSWQVVAGYEPASGQPGIILGPDTVTTFLTSPIAIGDVTMKVNDPIIPGGTAQIESGGNTESVTVAGMQGSPSGGPYTLTISAAAKAHPAGSAVIVPIATNKRGIIYFNNAVGAIQLPGSVILAGTTYIGGSADVQITRSSAGVLAFSGSGAGKGGIKLSVVTTATRPSASAVGVGVQLYDSTIGKQISSNGTAWTDALGNVV